jgi:RHS repeat-associated protein
MYLAGPLTTSYAYDALGSIRRMTDTLGNEVRSYRYDSFGQLTAETGTLRNPYTYTGRERDQESGLSYYRARYYDPAVGRFLSEDPIRGFLSVPKTLNLYPYVYNNPLRFVDPYGLLGFGDDLLSEILVVGGIGLIVHGTKLHPGLGVVGGILLGIGGILKIKGVTSDVRDLNDRAQEAIEDYFELDDELGENSC